MQEVDFLREGHIGIHKLMLDDFSGTDHACHYIYRLSLGTLFFCGIIWFVG